MAQKKGCFSDIRVFVLCFGLLFLTDIMAGVMKKSSLTTIERRFHLPTTVTALLASSFQIGNLTMLIFVSYFGSRWNRPRAIFLGSILLILGNFIVTIPQFVGDRYEYEDITKNDTSTNMHVGVCSSVSHNSTEENCNERENTPTNQLYILLVIGMMINGVGGTPIQPLGISYIDDFAHERNSPLYIGITTAIALLGPMFGYILSSVILKIWVDVGWMDTSEITIQPTHPSWVGAWWLGLLICTFGIMITTIPFWFFPKILPKQEYKSKKKLTDHTTELEEEKKIENEEMIEKNLKEGEEKKEEKLSVANEFKGMLNAFKRILKNKIFLLTLLKFYFSSASMVAVVNFFPKYLEVAFGVSASRANFLTGVMNIPCLVVGTIVGSYLMKRLNPTPPNMVKMIGISTFMATLCIFPLLIIGCDTIDIAGITHPYSEKTSTSLTPISECNADCGCKNGTYTPVCGADGISYISPCHAGCKEAVSDENGVVTNFTKCSCINPDSSEENWATHERCEFSNCPHLLMVVLAFKSAGNFFGGVAATPLYIFLIRSAIFTSNFYAKHHRSLLFARSVDKKDKAFAIGVNLLIIRLLAWIPGPLVYGIAIDSACIYWGIKPCTDVGYCKVFDNNKYRLTFYGIIIGFQILSCLTIIVLYIVRKRKYIKDQQKEKDLQMDNKEDEETKLSNGASETDRLT